MADVPFTYQTFDPTLPSCGPERIKIAEDWIQSRLKIRGDRPGLLLHSVRSGTGKTRVATHVATLGILPRWRGPCHPSSSGLWLNARRFRQKYQETMHFSESRERAAWVDKLCGCDLLVLDEPDKLKTSDGLTEVIYRILDERFAQGNSTILTTNAGGQELEKRWGPQYGPYLVRRIRDFCLSINFDPHA